jgi:hypothetical protein
MISTGSLKRLRVRRFAARHAPQLVALHDQCAMAFPTHVH